MKRTPFSRRKFVVMNYITTINSLLASLRKHSFLFFLALTLNFLFAWSGKAQSFTDTLKCKNAITVDIGGVLIGDTVMDSISLINRISSTDTTWNVSQNETASLKLSDTLGHADSGKKWNTFIVFTPKDTSSITVPISLVPTDDPGCASNINLTAHGIGPTKDSSTFSLQDTSEDVIAFQTNNNSDAGTFFFINNSDTAIEIDSIKISQTKAFSITSSPTLPLHLLSQASFPLGIAYQRTSQGSDNAELVIGVPNEPILPIALQGVRTGNDVVQTQPSGSIYFMLYPNPSYGPVTIHTENITQAHATITDVLGRTITEESFNGDWVWDGEQSGTYFVNITATMTDGTSLHEVRRVVMMK
jgi:hypothetical protein